MSDSGDNLSDLLSCSDTHSVGSDDTEPDVPSSDTNDSNPPRTPISSRQPTKVTIQSPGRSFSEQQLIKMPQAVLQGERSRGSLELYPTLAKLAVPAIPALSSGLPPRFLEWLAARSEIGREERDLMCKYLGDIRQLQFQWYQANRDGFVIRDLIGLSEHAYKLLQHILDETWNCKLGRGQELEFLQWIAFLRCMQIDFRPDLGKGVAIAPTFYEDLTTSITHLVTKVLREAEGDPLCSTVATLVKSTVETPVLHSRPKYSAIHVDAVNHHKALGPMIFFCAMAQTDQEFMYQANKLSLILRYLPSLLGFLIALVRPAPDHADLTKLHKVSGTSEWVQCRVLLYHSDDFPEFQERMSRIHRMEEWETDTHHMWLTSSSGEPQSYPPGAWKPFCDGLDKIVQSHAVSPPKRPFAAFTDKPQHQWLLSPEDEAAARRKSLAKDIAVSLNHSAHWVAGNTMSLRKGEGKMNLKWANDPYGQKGLFRVVLYK
ncbi:uncharacterized protein B0H18DRAFT_1126014 [Fomitopsis serialis]|uniref:uncharacterized protein n=1 Tax=Fomitopsis serialis TaxID=139415 RepID=UPI002008CC06|nr:uncharacterized protein B0H18DRAFT_1126014 [Neoantrodia serialis]KAH9913777.1 hypothetical protein B0H18DRAFT_1126014 [Neoantrodia serialis]